MSPKKNTMSAEPKKAVLYLRVSSTAQTKTATDIDKDGNSIATQREYGLQKALELNAEVVEEFVEPGVSAQTVTKRKAFNKMLAFLNENPDIDYVIIYARSRAFRNFTDAAITRRSLEEMGVKLISVREDFGEGVYADAMEAFTDIMNQVQNQLSGEDIKIKMHNKAKNGGTLGRAKLGYLNVRKDVDGYLVNSIDIDPKRGPLVKQAFELYATGSYTLDRLTAEMEDRGLLTKPTPRCPAKSVSKSHWHRILKDPYYTGLVTYKGEVYPGRHEPLLSRELFDRVQGVKSERMGAGSREVTHTHYLRGILRCKKCDDRKVDSRLLYTETIGASGSKHQYYFCAERQRNQSCDLPYLPVWEVENKVVDVMDQVQVNEAFIQNLTSRLNEALANEQASLTAARQQLESELAAANKKEERLVDAIADGMLTKDVAQKKLNDITAKKHSITQRLERNEESLSVGVTVLKDVMLLMTEPKENYIKAPDEYRRTALKTFFHHIKVGDEGSSIPETREPFVSIRQANEIFVSYPQGVANSTMSAERPGAFPAASNDSLARFFCPDEKTAQNAVFGVSGGSFGQKENDAENSASPLYSSLIRYYLDGCSSNNNLVRRAGLEPARP